MYELKIIDRSKPIILVRFKGVVSKEDVYAMNDEMQQAYEELGRKKFYILGDSSEAKIFGVDVKEAFMEHQKRFLPYVHCIAGVSLKSLQTNQFKDMSAQTNNTKENMFPSYEKALNFLLSQ